MPREITFSIGSEYPNGYLNSTFLFNYCAQFLNEFSYNWDLNFTQVPFGKPSRIKIIQAKTVGGPNWMAWTRGFEIRISPVMNFGKNLYACCRVMMHEFDHTILSAHTPMGGLMDVNASMPTGNLVQADYRYSDVYPRKPNVKLPHLEPGRIRNKYTALQTLVSSLKSNPNDELMYQNLRTSQFGIDYNSHLEHDPLIFGHISSWMDWLPRTLMKP